MNFMKPFLLLLLFSFLTGFNLQAQNYDSDLKIGAGVVHYPSPNASSLAFYGEFSRGFFPNTTLGIHATAALPTEYFTSQEEQKLFSYHFALNFYYNVIEQQQQNFNIGLGFTAGLYDIDWKVIATGQTGTDHTFQPGLAILMEYNLIFNKRIILGVSAKGLLYGDDKSAILGGLHGGYRF